MDDPAAELLWRGRLHLGDGPGVYGDASYVGLGVELPVTIRRFPDAHADADVNLVVEAEGVQAYGDLRGPVLSVTRYLPDEATGHWHEHALVEHRLTGETTTIAVNLGAPGPDDQPAHLGVRLRVDTEAPPGLYADFVLVALRLRSTTHYASLGFQASR